MKFLCALEAVNLDNLFSDCDDLSTVYGGGLAVLDIAQTAAAGLGLRDEDVISQGASQGVLRIEGETAEDVEHRVRRELLARQPILRHTTIMVAACLDEGDDKFAAHRAYLKTKMRWAQMQSLSVVYPLLAGEDVCKIDKVRPGLPVHDRKEIDRQSDFTNERRQLGRIKKRQLIKEILGPVATGIEVVENLDELASAQKGNLKDKIAVFRFDGNDFGKKAQSRITPADYREFSRTVQAQQREFFRRLLLEDGEIRQAWLGDDGKLRLEIAVYGGDEVSFLTPAELGWKALTVFYDAAQEWNLDRKPLTYCGGLVFCHHEAPIHAIKRLAGGLADWAKDWRKPKGNHVAYQVLESFDHLGRDLKESMEERYRHVQLGAAIGFSEIVGIEDGIDLWRSHVAKRKLHDVVREVMAGEPVGFEKAMMRLLETKSRSATKIEDQIRRLHERIGNAIFVHLLELWDYVGVTR